MASATEPDSRIGDSQEVSQENLLASERFWPYQVSLVRAWKAEGREQPLPPGSSGVLIRVETSGEARLDFGRDGLYRVPIAETDLVERANRVRRGEVAKTAPNFVLAIGPRLIDSAAEPMQPLRFARVAAHRGFLAVFSELEELAALAPVLAPLADRHAVLTIVFPQGEHPDSMVRERLRQLGWTVPFVYDHLAEAYTPSLLPGETRPPAVVLQTPEGRVVFGSRWDPDVGAKLAAAMEGEFGGEPAP